MKTCSGPGLSGRCTEQVDQQSLSTIAEAGEQATQMVERQAFAFREAGALVRLAGCAERVGR